MSESKCPNCGSTRFSRWHEDESFYASYYCPDCGYGDAETVANNKLTKAQETAEKWRLKFVALDLQFSYLQNRYATIEAERDRAFQMVERLIEAGKKLSIIALLNTREDKETWERWHALVAEWRNQEVK
jgi:transposase-like protein